MADDDSDDLESDARAAERLTFFTDAVISFYVIAAAWSSHHDLFRYFRRVDTRVRTLNTSWLLMIVITPFATRLLTTSGSQTYAVRFAFYSLVQLLDSAIMLAMLRHLVTHRQLAGLRPRVLTAMTWRNLSPAIAFGLSIPVFFLSTYGWVLWFLVPMALGRLHRIPPSKPGGPRDPGDPGRPVSLAGAGEPGPAA